MLAKKDNYCHDWKRKPAKKILLVQNHFKATQNNVPLWQKKPRRFCVIDVITEPKISDVIAIKKIYEMRSEARWCCNYLGRCSGPQTGPFWLVETGYSSPIIRVYCPFVVVIVIVAVTRDLFFFSLVFFKYYHKFVWTTLLSSYAVVESYHYIIIGFSSSIILE